MVYDAVLVCGEKAGWYACSEGGPRGFISWHKNKLVRRPVAHRRQGNDKSTPNTVAKDRGRYMRERTVQRTRARYGAWSEAELADHGANLERLVWVVACDIDESDDGRAILEAN